MKTNALLIFVCFISLLFFACPGGSGGDVGGDDDNNSPECPVELDSFSLSVDTTYNQGNNSVTMELSWDAIPGAESYELNVLPSQDTFQISAEQTSYTLNQTLALDTEILLSLSAKMGNGSTCGPLTLKSNYCNGGGTVEDVLPLVNWPQLCNESSCDFVRFKQQEVRDCNGDLLPLIPKKHVGGVYFKRSDLCDCLTDGVPSVCDGVEALRLNPCLDELQKCLKHDYEPCGE